jgi:hypothetical protein
LSLVTREQCPRPPLVLPCSPRWDESAAILLIVADRIRRGAQGNSLTLGLGFTVRARRRLILAGGVYFVTPVIHSTTSSVGSSSRFSLIIHRVCFYRRKIYETQSTTD